MDKVYNELGSLIKYVQSMYTEVSDKWIDSNENQINLKRIYVLDADKNSKIYELILKYREFLGTYSALINLGVRSVCSYKVMSRIKTSNSIGYKIQAYKSQRHQCGKVPIIKCLNDLFGVRIILEQPLVFADIRDFVKSEFPDACYRCIDSSKDEYRAVHLYFRAGNYAFPWDLQIWNECDTGTNLASHKAYKQDYVIWEKENDRRWT